MNPRIVYTRPGISEDQAEEVLAGIDAWHAEGKELFGDLYGPCEDPSCGDYGCRLAWLHRKAKETGVALGEAIKARYQ